MTCMRTSVGKTRGALRGYQGIVDSIKRPRPVVLAELSGIYPGTEERLLPVVKEAEVEVTHCGRFIDRANAIGEKLSDSIAQWLDGKAVFIFQTRQRMI